MTRCANYDGDCAGHGGLACHDAAAVAGKEREMALSARVLRVRGQVADVDRGVYQDLDLRMAMHPSESPRYFWARLIAYCLQWEPGIAFSRGGLSSTEDPPLSVQDDTGILRAWIDVGAPSADRLNRASKAAGRVALYTWVDLALLTKEYANKRVYRIADIAVWPLAPALMTALEPLIDREIALELTRSDGRLYLGVGGQSIEADLQERRLIGEVA